MRLLYATTQLFCIKAILRHESCRCKPFEAMPLLPLHFRSLSGLSVTIPYHVQETVGNVTVQLLVRVNTVLFCIQ